MKDDGDYDKNAERHDLDDETSNNHVVARFNTRFRFCRGKYTATLVQED